MCRIFGKFGGAPLTRDRILAAQAIQRHGGPDQQGWLEGPGWCLGANRLAIQGLAHGDQPYVLEDGIYAVFNGEIYNHRELRGELAARGRIVPGTCDGSLIPDLYAEFGADMFRRLDGMFAIALIDLRGREPELTLACDHLAIKSLYYRWDAREGALTFASEVEGLAVLSLAPLVALEERIESIFAFRAPLGPTTMFADVAVLTPGQVITLRGEGPPREGRFHLPGEGVLACNDGDPDELRALLRAETTRLLDADAPVCMVTSGGLDSSLLTALACESGRPIHCFNIAYKGSWPAEERHHARAVADHVGACYHQVELDPADIPSLVSDMVRHLGGPNSAPHSLSTYVLFEAIHRAGYKVAVTGDGADELFGGYDRFGFDISADGWLKRYLDSFAPVPEALRFGLYHSDFKAKLAEVPPEREQLGLALAEAARGGLEGLLQLELIERFPNYILRRVDHLSMAHAVEVRVPFCQRRVRDWARRVPARRKIAGAERKLVLTEAAVGLLPESILTRRKQPFTLPITEMIRPGERLFDLIADVVGSLSFRSRGIFAAEAADRLLAEQSKVRSPANAQALWMMTVCEMWFRHHEEASREAAGLSGTIARRDSPVELGMQER